jgi:hypothetical protein
MATNTARTLPGSGRKGKGGIHLVATNPEYARLCVRSVGRLPATVRGRIKVDPQGAVENEGSELTLFVSRLSDPLVASPSVGGNSRRLLFLEGLPVEAVPARLLAMNVRDSRRLHIAAHRDLRGIESLVFRIVSGLADVDGRPTIADAWMENDSLVVLSAQFERIVLPLDVLGRFVGKSRAAASRYEIDEDGAFLHWPETDTHLGWNQLLQLVDPAAELVARGETAQFNARYGAAIRAVRERAGLKQTEIDGLTERQLRRVEHGEQAVTPAAMRALARAHDLSPTDYLDRLAKQLSHGRN